MPARASRRLVVDACVARACGGPDATFPTSKHCRDFLMVMLGAGHSVVMTADVLDEWKRHRSAFARRWRLQMVARKRGHMLDVPPDTRLREQVAGTADNDAQREAMLKDCHLLEAALASDRCVVCLDDRVRGLFHNAAGHAGVLRRVVWVNPGSDDEEPILWLQEGAKPEKHRFLGFTPDE